MKQPRIQKLEIKQGALPLTGESTTFAPLNVQVGGSHYKQMAIQPVEFCEMNQIPYCMANAIKYLCRHKLKHGREDLEKAAHYCDLGYSMYEGTKKAWRYVQAEWVIAPVRFCQDNKLERRVTSAFMSLCAVFTKGSHGYIDAKKAIEEIIKVDYPPVRPR